MRAVMIDDFGKCAESSVMHIGCGQGDIAQGDDPEPASVIVGAGNRFPAEVLADTVQAVIRI